MRKLIIVFKWSILGLFFVYFCLFHTNITIFTTNQCEKCRSSIRNSRQPEHGLLPVSLPRSLNLKCGINKVLLTFKNPPECRELTELHQLTKLKDLTIKFQDHVIHLRRVRQYLKHRPMQPDLNGRTLLPFRRVLE